MPIHDQNAAELIALCLETGSESAWRQLVARLQPLIASVVSGVVRSYGQSNNIVDDLVQETFLRLCRDDSRVLRNFDHRHEGGIFGYVRRMAASVANDYFRALNAQKRMGEYAVDPEDLAHIAVTSGASADELMLLRQIENYIERVADTERDLYIYRLYYHQGFTAKDIASIPSIGLSPKGVESCLLRMIKAVQREISRGSSYAEGSPPPSALGEMR
jgi:RNA polymerase sigma-70 factor (ECF subfamily)